MVILRFCWSFRFPRGAPDRVDAHWGPPSKSIVLSIDLIQAFGPYGHLLVYVRYDNRLVRWTPTGWSEMRGLIACFPLSDNWTQAAILFPSRVLTVDTGDLSSPLSSKTLSGLSATSPFGWIGDLTPVISFEDDDMISPELFDLSRRVPTDVDSCILLTRALSWRVGHVPAFAVSVGVEFNCKSDTPYVCANRLMLPAFGLDNRRARDAVSALLCGASPRGPTCRRSL
jgi:hypothetical protein